MPDIHNLVRDINKVIDDGGGWDATISKLAAEGFQDILDTRLSSEREEHKPTLRLSALGTPCERKLWYSINDPDGREALPSSARLKFLYGDLLEQLLLSLAVAAGHDVQGEQDTLSVAGIKGHRDAVIDGITVDVKSASPFGYKKFAQGGLRDDDPFGYISQLSSYVYAGRNSDVESHPTLGAFLVVDKVNGHICLDMYDFGPEIDTKVDDVEHIKDMVRGEMPDRSFEPEPMGKAGNMKLPMQCSYCDRKWKCWDNLRMFAYSHGPAYLTTVVDEPRVPEVTP